MHFNPKAPFALLPLLLVGCASQQSLTEQTQPLLSRLDRLEQALQAANEAGKARHETVTKEIGALQAAMRVLGDRVGQTDANLDKVAIAGREAAEQAGAARDKLAERLTQNELRLDELTSETRSALDQVDADQARLAERATQSELRLDQLVTETGEAAAQADAAQAGLATRLAQTESRLDEFATTLPERLSESERRLDELAGAVKAVMAMATQEAIRLNGKEVFAVALTEDKTLYPINSPELGAQDLAKLDDLLARLDKLEQDYHLEIQGHTDNIGTEDYNYELGKARADVVKRYLHEKKGISLSQMSVISFGAGRPVDVGGGRNRRIAIRVLVLK